MPQVSLSEHCSLMAKPGGPPKPATRPADCPPDAAYITAVGGGAMTIPGNAPFPIVFEGGDGDDHVTIVGSGKGGVLVRGGRGDDSLVVHDQWTWLARQIGPGGVLLLGLAGIVFAAVVTIAWRALRSNR